MSKLLLHPALFQGKTIHTLTVDGRAAWIARQVGDVLGYANAGKRLVGKITNEWSDDFVIDKDYAMLAGAELVAIKAAEIDVVARQAKGVVVLFESGLHLALIKSQMPQGRALRRFLVDEVLPQLVRTGAYVPGPQPETVSTALDLAMLHEVRLAVRVELDDRKFRSVQLRQAADTLFRARKIDQTTWVECVIASAELAMGHALPGLASPPDRWTPATALAERLQLPLPRVLAAAARLELLDDKPGVCRPVPTREGNRWTVTFAFSAKGVAQIEAWLAETTDDSHTAAARAA